LADRLRHGLLGTVGDPRLDTGRRPASATGQWPASDRPEISQEPAREQHCRMVAAEELDSADLLELMSSLPSDLSDGAELEALLGDVDVRVWGVRTTPPGRRRSRSHVEPSVSPLGR